MTKLSWYGLTFPRDVPPERRLQAFRLLATGGGTPLVLEATATTDDVQHRLGLDPGRSGAMASQLRQAIPGLDLMSADRPDVAVSRAVALGLSTRRRQLRLDDEEDSSRALLAALAHVGRGETITLQWVLTRVLVPTSVPNRMRVPDAESLPAQLALSPIYGASELDPELRSALRTKQAEFGWRAVGRIGVKAAGRTRERQLIRQVLDALRVLEGPGVGFRVFSRTVRGVRFASTPWLTLLRVNAMELAALSSWPCGSTLNAPVRIDASVRLSPPRGTPHRGRVLGDANVAGHTRPVALSPRDSLRHLHVLGPTGSGKSTLLCNLIVQDMEAGERSRCHRAARRAHPRCTRQSSSLPVR